MQPTSNPSRRGAALLLAGVLTLAGRGGCLAEDPPAAPDIGGFVGRLLKKAREAVAAKDVAGALPTFMKALREADDYATKYAIRDEVLGLPPVAGRVISESEQGVVDYRIAEEREKDVEKKAGALEGKGHVHAARLLNSRLMTLVGMGPALTDKHRLANERIDNRLCEEATEEERKEARDVEGELTDAAGAMAKAQKIAEEGRGRVSLRIYRAIAASSIPAAALRDKARDEADALRKRMIDTISPEEQQEADDVWFDPHWRGIATSVSHEFIYIGAKAFVDSLTDTDRIRMDVACVMLGDLVGRDMTDDHVRLTIYYKERFDFAGGVAGGKRIDIGNKAIGRPIAGALHYHELSHCVFDVGMIYQGFIEGIANFGAVFLLDAMGQPTEADRAIASNRKFFQEDYLDRRLKYWRIQPYGPSAGFLLTPITEQNPEARKLEWLKYRKFFAALRAHSQEEPRDAERIRWFAYHWGEVFGWPMIDTAASDRFPVVPADREHVAAEEKDVIDLVLHHELYARNNYGEGTAEALEADLKKMHSGEWRDRAKFALARIRMDAGETAARDAVLADLGVLSKWKLCGPFYTKGASPLFAVHPPEKEIDLAAEYPNPVQIAKWKDAHPDWEGVVDFIQHGYEYPDDAACYALAYLTVPADVPDATFFLGFDDTCAMWVNGELMEKWDDPHGLVRDQHVALAPLKAGRNRVLLKVVNRRGAWQFCARVVHADRTPIVGLAVVDPPPKDAAAPLPEWKGHAVFQEDFEKAKGLPKGKIRSTAGAFSVDQKCLRATTPGNVLWRKFLIKPDLNKDPPSALAWLADKSFAGLTDFAVALDLTVPGAGLPKIAVTVHGEERDDGLSGHTFIVQPGGEGMEVRLEEYDRLVYYGSADIPKSPDHTFKVLRRGRTLSCSLDGVSLLDGVDLPALPRPGIGVMAWNRDTGISKIRVEKPK